MNYATLVIALLVCGLCHAKEFTYLKASKNNKHLVIVKQLTGETVCALRPAQSLRYEYPVDLLVKTQSGDVVYYDKDPEFDKQIDLARAKMNETKGQKL